MGEGKGQEDTPRQAKQILMWGPSVGVIFGGRLSDFVFSKVFEDFRRFP